MVFEDTAFKLKQKAEVAHNLLAIYAYCQV